MNAQAASQAAPNQSVASSSGGGAFEPAKAAPPTLPWRDRAPPPDTTPPPPPPPPLQLPRGLPQVHATLDAAQPTQMNAPPLFHHPGPTAAAAQPTAQHAPSQTPPSYNAGHQAASHSTSTGYAESNWYGGWKSWQPATVSETWLNEGADWGSSNWPGGHDASDDQTTGRNDAEKTTGSGDAEQTTDRNNKENATGGDAQATGSNNATNTGDGGQAASQPPDGTQFKIVWQADMSVRVRKNSGFGPGTWLQFPEEWNTRLEAALDAGDEWVEGFEHTWWCNRSGTEKKTVYSVNVKTKVQWNPDSKEDRPLQRCLILDED